MASSEHGVLFTPNAAFAINRDDQDVIRRGMLTSKHSTITDSEHLKLRKINPVTGQRHPEPPHTITVQESLDSIYNRAQMIHDSYQKWVLLGTTMDALTITYEYFSLLKPGLATGDHLYDALNLVGFPVTVAMVTGGSYLALNTLSSIIAAHSVSSETHISFPAIFAYASVRSINNLIKPVKDKFSN